MMEVLHHDHVPGCLLAFISYFLNWKKREAKYLKYQKDNQIQKNITNNHNTIKKGILNFM